MAEPKTQKTNASVAAFLDGIDDKRKRADCKAISKMMRDATGNRAKMWGTTIIGYGSYRYKYASGREGDWAVCGFSPRAQNITVYIMPGFKPFGPLMKKLGKYKTGKSCLYINKLDDIDLAVLEDLVGQGLDTMKRMYGA